MSSKNLYINGCSFTYGDNLPKEQTWPELLSKKLNLNLINESKNGQSFQSITFNSINTLSELNPENTIPLKSFGFRKSFISLSFILIILLKKKQVL